MNESVEFSFFIGGKIGLLLLHKNVLYTNCYTCNTVNTHFLEKLLLRDCQVQKMKNLILLVSFFGINVIKEKKLLHV